jgi:hypothetical protein
MQIHVDLSIQVLIIRNLCLIENLYDFCTIYACGMRLILHQIDHEQYIQKYQLPTYPLYMRKRSKMMQVNDEVNINNNFLMIE